MVRNGKKRENLDFSSVGCNFRKGNNLGFCRESNSQRRGRGFESHLLHQ
jgi:hypothetical protein